MSNDLVHNALLFIQRSHNFLDGSLREYFEVGNIGNKVNEQIFL